MVLLTAHLLNGQKIGVDIPVNSIIKVPFLVEDTPSPGYADISSIENWWEFGKDLRDYLYVRTRIQEIATQKGIEAALGVLSDPPTNPANNDFYNIATTAVATGAWAGYEGWNTYWDEAGGVWRFEPPEWLGYRVATIEEKDILSQLKIGSQANHFIDYGVPAIVNYGFEYHKQARATRENRMLRAVVEVYNIIPLNVAEALGDITASPLGDMYFRYMEFGVKGTVEDFNKDFNSNPTPGITDWVYARAPFNGQEPYLSAAYPTGLTLKPWTPIDGTSITAFADKIYGILVNGDEIS